MRTQETITTDCAAFKQLEAMLIPQVDETVLSQQIELGIVALNGGQTTTEIVDQELAFLTSGVEKKPGFGRGDLRHSKTARDEAAFAEKQERRRQDYTRKPMPSIEDVRSKETARRNSAARTIADKKFFGQFKNRNFAV